MGDVIPFRQKQPSGVTMECRTCGFEADAEDWYDLLTKVIGSEPHELRCPHCNGKGEKV